MLKDAVWLAKKEYKYQWAGAILTFLVSIVMGLFAGIILADAGDLVLRVNSISVTRFLLDLLFIGMAPSFATLFMSKAYLSYQEAKQDPYGKRMAVLRSLPIPVSVLALSRTLMMLFTLFVLSFAFYGTMAMVVFVHSNSILGSMTSGEFMIFILVWFGYTLAFGGMNPYIEYGTNGKVLHILPFIYIGLFIILEMAFYHYFGQGIVEESIRLVKGIGWPLAALSLTVGGLCCYGWYKLLKNRLQNRDYV